MIQGCEDGPPSQTRCIYRVPIEIRQLKGNAYTPKVVSIGPFHYGNEKLQDMEKYKPILFRRFIHRLGQYSTPSLDNLVDLVKDLEPKIRASYSETISLNKQQLVKLTLMDACFIIELFLMYFEGNVDTEFIQPWLWKAIDEDLILLENQLPFFIIEELFNQAFLKQYHEWVPSFLELTYNYFEYYNKQGLEPMYYVKIEHFTALLRLFYLDKGGESLHFTSSHNGSHRLLDNVNALYEAGVKLKASTSKCLLKLKFSGHFLEIPQIWVEDGTEILFRNMIALEQCHHPYEAYITDYVIVMDWLIDTCKDVELLVRKKIVRNYLREPNNVAVLFNGLAENVCQMNFNPEYVAICNKLNDYCEEPVHRMRANLIRDYCRTPWQIVASTGSIVLVVLTVVETVFSILKLVKEIYSFE